MVVVDKKGCHHVCTTSPGEHGFLRFTFQGLGHTTEIPNLALESVQATTTLKRPASGAKTVAKAKAVSKKPAAKGKSGAKSMAEPSPADIAPDHQLEEIVSASPSNVSKTYKYASLGLRREFGDKQQIWSRSMTNIDTEKAMAQVREAIAKLKPRRHQRKRPVMCWMTKYKPVRFESLKLFHICTSKDSTEDKSEEKHFGYVDQTSLS